MCTYPQHLLCVLTVHSGLQSNKPGHIIILYDDNERMAPQAATVFVQRGVDNVFLLSGGLTLYITLQPTHVLIICSMVSI